MIRAGQTQRPGARLRGRVPDRGPGTAGRRGTRHAAPVPGAASGAPLPRHEARERLVERPARAHRGRHRVRVRAVIAADLDGRALDRGELGDDRLLALGERGREGARSAPPSRRPRPGRRAPAPSRAPGRSGSRGCRSRPPSGAEIGSPRARARSLGRASARATSREGSRCVRRAVRRTGRARGTRRASPSADGSRRRTAARAWAPTRPRRSRTGRRRSSGARPRASSRSCRARGSGRGR